MLCPQSVLSSGEMKMPVIGLGTWQSSPEAIETALISAIDAGYRHIDTAYLYSNEASIGSTLKKVFDAGRIKREQLFIVTKLPTIGNRPEDVEPFLKKSLEALQLDYVDLYLIHGPFGLINRGELHLRDEKGQLLLDKNTDLLAIWKAMEEQVFAGRTKSIGISNFNAGQIKRIMYNCRVRPSNLQVELHVYLQQKKLVSFCRANGITVCAYAPLGSPGLKGLMEKRTGRSFEVTKGSPPLEDPVIVDIARKHNKKPSQVLLRYLIEYGVAVIPKSVTPERIKENIDIFNFELAKEEFEKISALDRGEEGRMFGSAVLGNAVDHPEYPFK